MNNRLLLVFLVFAPACVFTDLAELPPPIAIVNNVEPDLLEDLSADMDTTDMGETCALTPRSLTTDNITHFAADRFADVVFYAVRLSTGGIRLGRIEGDSVSSSFATTSIPGGGIHSISVAAVDEQRMLLAILMDETRLVRVWSCTSNGCTSFGTTGLQNIREMQLAGGDPPMLGYVRGVVPNQEFVAQGIDLDMNAIIPGQALRATLLTGVEGMSFAAGIGNNHRVAFGSPLNGYHTAFGSGMLEPEKCLTFEKRATDKYFTRVKRLNEFFLLRADGLYLTNCTTSLQLTPRLPADADVVPLAAGGQAFVVWPDTISGSDRVRGAVIESGTIQRTVDLGEWPGVSHIRAFRTASDLMVFFGGEGTHLQFFQASAQDLVTCFRND